MPKAMVIPQQH